MKKILFFIILILSVTSYAQEENISDIVSGKVQNASNDQKLQNVHIINLSQVVGTITNDEGDFKIQAKVNDTLYFSYIYNH